LIGFSVSLYRTQLVVGLRQVGADLAIFRDIGPPALPVTQ
jgi:hypothetical protein